MGRYRVVDGVRLCFPFSLPKAFLGISEGQQALTKNAD